MYTAAVVTWSVVPSTLHNCIWGATESCCLEFEADVKFIAWRITTAFQPAAGIHHAYKVRSHFYRGFCMTRLRITIRVDEQIIGRFNTQSGWPVTVSTVSHGVTSAVTCNTQAGKLWNTAQQHSSSILFVHSRAPRSLSYRGLSRTHNSTPLVQLKTRCNILTRRSLATSPCRLVGSRSSYHEFEVLPFLFGLMIGYETLESNMWFYRLLIKTWTVAQLELEFLTTLQPLVNKVPISLIDPSSW